MSIIRIFIIVASAYAGSAVAGMQFPDMSDAYQAAEAN